MRAGKIVPRRVGRWCLPYLYQRIREASPLLQETGEAVNLAAGYIFVYAPENAPTERLRQLPLGGLIPGEWITPARMRFNPEPSQRLSRYLDRWLRERTARQPSCTRVLLAEESLWRPGDPIPTDHLRAFAHEGTLYLWAQSHDTASWIETLVRAVDQSYPPALIYGFEIPGLLAHGDTLVPALRAGPPATAHLKLIVAGVFDGESFLIWRRSAKKALKEEPSR